MKNRLLILITIVVSVLVQQCGPGHEVPEVFRECVCYMSVQPPGQLDKEIWEESVDHGPTSGGTPSTYQDRAEARCYARVIELINQGYNTQYLQTICE